MRGARAMGQIPADAGPYLRHDSGRHLGLARVRSGNRKPGCDGSSCCGSTLQSTTPRGMVDCMIAAVARRNTTGILAADTDLSRIAGIIGTPYETP